MRASDQPARTIVGLGEEATGVEGAGYLGRRRGQRLVLGGFDIAEHQNCRRGPDWELLQLLSSAALELDGVVIAVLHVLIETDHQDVLDRRHAMLVLHPLRHFDPEHGALGYARRAVLGRLEAFAAEGRVAAEGVELVGGALAGLLGLHAFQAVVTHEDSPSIEGNGNFIVWNDNPHARWGHAK